MEHALLDVLPGREAAFEAADGPARPLIARQPGFRSLRLEHCVEQSNRYLLLVEWDQLEDHTEGFRTSSEYGRWRELLHRPYDPLLSSNTTNRSSCNSRYRATLTQRRNGEDRRLQGQFLYWLCLRLTGTGLTVESLTEGWLGFRRRERVWFERHGRPESDPART